MSGEITSVGPDGVTSHDAADEACAECGHRHAGEELGYICVGCPCEADIPVDATDDADEAWVAPAEFARDDPASHVAVLDDRPVIVSAFAGVGGFDLGFERAGYQTGALIEWDAAATRVLAARFPDAARFTDVRKVDGDAVRSALGGRRVDVLTGGFPCFPDGTLILTRRGLVAIEQVETGDEVLTHRNRWRHVMRNHGSHEAPVVEMTGQGGTLVATGNHPLWARRRGRRMLPRAADGKRRTTPTWGEPGWREASAMAGWHWSSPSEFPDDKVPQVETRGRERAYDVTTPEAAHVIGRWLADGYCYADNGKDRVVVTSAHGEAATVRAEMDAAGIAWSAGGAGGTAAKTMVCSQALARWLTEHFGRHAHRKSLPGWALGAPREWREALLSGYIAGDGSPLGDGWRTTTVSRRLAVGTRLLAQSLGWSVSTAHTEGRGTTVIEGRTVNERPSWQVIARRKARSSHDDEGQRWGCVRSVRPAAGGRPVRVWNIEVEGDHSYVADGVTVRNCQDLSVAGRRAGLAGERSGLYGELLRLARELDPEWLVVENVPGLLSSAAGYDFATFLGDVTGFYPDVPDGGWRNSGVCEGERAGCAWRVLDARHFGVAQRRRRVFALVNTRDRAAPAAVLLEPEGVRRHPSPRVPTWARPARAAMGTSLRGRPSRAERGGAGDATAGALTGSVGGGDENDASNARLVVAADARNGNVGEVAGTLQSHGQSYSLNAQPMVVDRRAEGVQEYPDGNWGLEPHASTLCVGRRSSVVERQVGHVEAHGGDDIAPTVTSKWHTGSGGPSGSETPNLVAETFAVRGGDDGGYTVEPTETCHTVDTNGAWGRGNQGGTVAVVGAEPPPVAAAHETGQGWWNGGDIAGTLRAENHDGTIVGQPAGKAFIVSSANSHEVESHGRETETARCLDTSGGFAASQGGTVVTVVGDGGTDVTHPVTASGTDGMGRGVPAIAGYAYPIAQDALRGAGAAETPSPDAEGRVRLRDPGLGVYADGDPSPTVVSAGPPAVAYGVAMRGRDEGNVPEVTEELVSGLRASSGGSTRDLVVPPPTAAYIVDKERGLPNDEGIRVDETDVAPTITADGDPAERTDRGLRIIQREGVDVLNGETTGDVAHTLRSQDQGVPRVIEQHAPEVAAPLTAGSHSPGVSAPGRRQEDDVNLVAAYRKSRRAATDDDAETWVEADHANTLNTFDGGDARATEVVVDAPFMVEPESGQGADLRARPTEHAPSLTAHNGQEHDRGVRVASRAAVRRLTPRECERLQSFPDDWTLVPDAKGRMSTDSPRYKALGNAVCANVAEWIACRILDYEDG